VHRSTLYAYVSRGQVRAQPDPAAPHASRYLTADVERLVDRQRARRDPGDAARKTLHFGLPVLQSAITSIENGRPSYRGRDVEELARTATFEETAALLWQTDLVPRRAPEALPRALLTLLRPLAAADRLQVVLPLAAHRDRAQARDAATGWRIVRRLAMAATLRPMAARESMAVHLAHAWRIRQRGAIDPVTLVNAALVVCADHELNVSAFAVRVAASAGSSLHDAVLAGLCALRGDKHGGQTDLVERLIAEARTPSRLDATVARLLQRNERVPGFGHPLYPDGDPRARVLVDSIVRGGPASREAEWADAFARVGAARVEEFPTIDVALVLVRRALGLPPGAAFLLFAIGRSVGWIAHAMEQYASPQIIRPRAESPR
jgi:citrate synthase